MGAARGPGDQPLRSPLAEKASWSGEQPQFWSKAQVLDWISYQVERNKVDASAIDFSRCDMDGATLCSCAPEELRLVFGPLGDQLYSQLWDMSECQGGSLSVGLVRVAAPCPQAWVSKDAGRPRSPRPGGAASGSPAGVWP